MSEGKNMKPIIAAIALLTWAGAAQAQHLLDFQTSTPQPIGPISGVPICTDPAPGSWCYELLVIGKTESSKLFDALEIGPGGRICGPAVVRIDKDTIALTLSKGVCIPAEKK
jgi:hypothetical protein